MKILFLSLVTVGALSGSTAFAEDSSRSFSWYCAADCEKAGRFSKLTGVFDYTIEGYGNSRLEAFAKMAKQCTDGGLYRLDFNEVIGRVHSQDLSASPRNSCTPQQ